jgi:hypothetical protein
MPSCVAYQRVSRRKALGCYHGTSQVLFSSTGFPDKALSLTTRPELPCLLHALWAAHGVLLLLQVAFYSICRLMSPWPTLRGARMSVLVLLDACSIIFPIIGAEGFRAVFMPWAAPRPRVSSSSSTTSTSSIPSLSKHTMISGVEGR